MHFRVLISKILSCIREQTIRPVASFVLPIILKIHFFKILCVHPTEVRSMTENKSWEVIDLNFRKKMFTCGLKEDFKAV